MLREFEGEFPIPGDVKPVLPQANGPSMMRDRFVGFAFAAADMLIETDLNGTIQFAAGTFKHWFGTEPELMIGQPMAGLLNPADRAGWALYLNLAASKGRILPINIKLANPATTPMILSGLWRPGSKESICFSLSRLPTEEPAPEASGVAHALQDAIRGHIGAGAHASLGLIEIKGLPAARGNAQELNQQISTTLLAAAGEGATSEQLANGRFGLVAPGNIDIPHIVSQLQRFLSSGAEAGGIDVTGTGLSLETGLQLTQLQASSTVRYALSSFAKGGLEQTRKAGFSDGLLSFVADAGARASSMRSIIKAHRFKLRFQPIVSLATGLVHHFEALLRPIPTVLNPSDSPQEFVEFAEAVGLAEELDLAVMGVALDVMRECPAHAVAINMSGASVQNPEFSATATQLIRDAVRRDRLRPLIEITETVDITDVVHATATVMALREAGAEMCLDDFGAGAASYRYLRDFQVDYVKVDGSFVRKARSNTKSHAMIISMVELANFIGAKVIAEMVENEETAALMREAGVDFGQGWLFGKPGQLPGTKL